jgi:hypothetical protein
MGIYGDYLGEPFAGDFDKLTAERKQQLRRISQLRGGRDVLVFAADMNKETPLAAIGYSDILPITDLVSNLNGTAIDIILETPGGSGEGCRRHRPAITRQVFRHRCRCARLGEKRRHNYCNVCR